MLRDIIDKLELKDFEPLFNSYKDYLAPTKFKNPSAIFESGTDSINAFVVRDNKVYTTNDMVRNNDYLIVTQNAGGGSGSIYIFSATADPKARINKIANTLPCQWMGNIRGHHWLNSRPAICQDNDDVWVRRYTGKGADDFYEEKGHFTIHIHDSGGLFNTSLGCTIMANEDSYQKMLKPLLNEVKQFQDKVPVSFFNSDVFTYLVEKILA
ncbi:hypothetical protein BH10BAC5_BH10BAC5_16830 [soil metagenome]